MGLAIILEVGHGTDVRLRYALRSLALFGLIHGLHEWLEMFNYLGQIPGIDLHPNTWEGLRILILAFSFVILSIFGASLLANDETMRRFSLVITILLTAIWAFGIMIMRPMYSQKDFWDVADVWTRYVLAVPAALLACIGLIFQQRVFRRQGMAEFGRDSLWAAIAFFWYGIVGQTFVRQSPLPPSNVINQGVFLEVFGFPIQLLRGIAAVVAAIFVIRFLRSFEVETQHKIAVLQANQLDEAKRRETLRSDMMRRIVTAQEAERQRIARELHDATGQSLTAIGLGLRGASSILHQDTKKAVNNIRQLENLTTSALVELQRIIDDLRPSHLDDLGLPAALRWYAGEIQIRVPIHVTVDVNGDNEVPLSTELKTTLFRITQEALTNVVKHAEAKNVTVELNFEPESVHVSIKDDGCGFNPGRMDVTGRPSWGLLGMRERASLMGGSVNLISKPGKGTTVEVVIPYHQESEDVI